MDKDDAHCQCNGLTFGDSEHQHSGQGTFASQDSALRFLRHLLLSLYSLGHGTWRHRSSATVRAVVLVVRDFFTIIESGGALIHLPAFWIRVAKWKPSKDEARFLHGV
ncbi:hypothetical protein POTOM_044285 [Populus tomentosa]|uniref:Uncharacterized protein n=1 Tax=Populus tomentosa TaxID=118781 RepID=A0A8X7YM08_POPTO|nr:hypothetical protein POTOM_044285 [Populus tomentosa]